MSKWDEWSFDSLHRVRQRPETMDPALKKLMDSLPKGEPDPKKEPPALAVVWSPLCEGRHWVPIHQKTPVDFGVWNGPSLRRDEILIHAEFRGRYLGSATIPEVNDQLILPGQVLILTVEVTPTR